MTCHRTNLGNGDFIITCTRGRQTRPCRFCGKRSSLQCDFGLKGSKSGKTCSAYMCSSCSTPQGQSANGETVDHCPPHARLAAKRAESAAAAQPER